jgi:hypothetical protein
MARLLLLALPALVCLLAAPGAVAAESAMKEPKSTRETRCAGDLVLVRTADGADASIVCGAARDAIAFLESQGLGAPAEVSIEVARKLPVVAGPSAAGCYLKRENRVIVLGYAEFKDYGTWFGLPIDRDLYRSLIAHEVAHAVGECNFRVESPPIEATEYLAYVTMFATMGPSLRARALTQFPGDGFDNEAEINSMIYMLDPMRFGTQAYRHYLKPGNGREFLRAVVEGRVVKGD